MSVWCFFRLRAQICPLRGNTRQKPALNLTRSLKQSPKSTRFLGGSGVPPVGFCVASPQTSATSKHGQKRVTPPNHWTISYMMIRVGSAFSPQKIHPWHLFQAWKKYCFGLWLEPPHWLVVSWNLGRSRDHGIGGEIPPRNHQGELWKENLEPSEPSTEQADFGFKMFAIFQAVSGGNTMPAHQKYRCVCSIVFI